MGVQKWTPIFYAQIQKGGDAMYFTSGQDRAFERLMQEKPSFDHYDGGGANAPEDCGSCRFYRPDWKYQYCVYAKCPYQPGKLTAFAAVKFTVKGADNDMAVFRVETNKCFEYKHILRHRPAADSSRHSSCSTPAPASWPCDIADNSFSVSS